MERRAQCRQSIAGRESGVAGSNSHVYKTTSNTDIQQHLNTEVQIPTHRMLVLLACHAVISQYGPRPAPEDRKKA
jgi:hypothetical protein